LLAYAGNRYIFSPPDRNKRALSRIDRFWTIARRLAVGPRLAAQM
jgi:hypothetical protein